jgi:uncharacterized membrane protein
MGVLAAVFGPGAVVSLLVSVGLCVLGVVAVVKIITKAGYSGWWALVPLSPVAVWIVNFAVLVHAANSPFSSSTSGSFDAASFVGLWVLDTVDALVILVFVLVFAFSEWPVHQQLRTQERRLQRAAEVLSAVLPPLRGKTRDPGWYAVGTAPNDQAYWDGQAWTARRRWSGASWTESSVGPTDTEGRPMTTVAATKATASTTASKKRMRQGQIVGLVVVVLVLAGAVSAVVLLRLTPLELPTGSETGTIQITTAGRVIPRSPARSPAAG